MYPTTCIQVKKKIVQNVIYLYIKIPFFCLDVWVITNLLLKSAEIADFPVKSTTNAKPPASVRILSCSGVLKGCSGVFLGCSGVVLGCFGVLLGCSGVLLGCSGVLSGCSGVPLGCSGVLLGCSGVLLSCSGVLLGCSGIQPKVLEDGRWAGHL